MTEHNQKLEPSRFDLNAGTGADAATASRDKAGATAPGSSSARVDAGASSQKMTVLGLGVLMLIAALVFFWLPERVATPEVDIRAAAEQKMPSATPANTASPWSDAQSGKLRKEAQEVLAVLLEEQFALDEIAVTEWAPAKFAAAQAHATRGDDLYRQQQYVEAAAAYQQGLDSLRALRDEAPQVFEQLLQQGQLALDNNQAEVALPTFELALRMQPDSTIAARGLKRAGSLDAVLGLLAGAREARAAGDLERAQQLQSQALELDPEHAPAKAELADTRREMTRRNFNRAMTAGYQALDRGDYDRAEKQFLAAQRIQPSAQETESALLEARTSRTRQQIDELHAQALAAERNEQWQQAANAYRAILGIDESVVLARNGSTRSRTRADVDTRLQQIITKPERLSDPAVFSQAQRLQAQAEKIPQPGPRLRQQLATVATLLEQALTPVSVLLQSDERTDVTVYRVAHLGTFSRHQLQLKPGTYTAVGVRNGYRDVRQEFTLRHDQASPVIDIRCTDRI